MERFCVAAEQFYVAIELTKLRRNYATIEKFYVAIKLARVGRIFVVTEDFYVAIELAMTESSVAHERARCAKDGMHESVVQCCVVTEEAMCERQTRLSAHDRPWAFTIEVGAR